MLPPHDYILRKQILRRIEHYFASQHHLLYGIAVDVALGRYRLDIACNENKHECTTP